jgi:hypothetical protein
VIRTTSKRIFEPECSKFVGALVYFISKQYSNIFQEVMIQASNSIRKRSAEQLDQKRQKYAQTKLMISTPEGMADYERNRTKEKENKIKKHCAFLMRERERVNKYNHERREIVKEGTRKALELDPSFQVAKRVRSEPPESESLARWNKQRYENIKKRRNELKLAELLELRKENTDLRIYCESNIISKAPVTVDQALLKTWMQHSPEDQAEWLVQNGHFTISSINQMTIDGGENYVTGLYIMIKVTFMFLINYKIS